MIVTFLDGNVLRPTRSPDETHLLRIKKAKVDCLANVPVGFRPRLADFKNFERGKLESAAVHDSGGAFQQLCSFFKWSPAPFFERVPRGFDRAFRLGNPGFGDCADDIAGRTWIN